MTLPEQMTDRWRNRAEPGPGEATVYWHMLMRDYPEIVKLARQAQQRLAGFGGLHMSPLQWLHITTLVAGPAADFSPQQLQQMSETAADLLASTPPATVTLGQVLYHPEAIMLGVSPAEALTPIYCAARTATEQVTTGQSPPAQSARWTPHITICYSTSGRARRARAVPRCGPDLAAIGQVGLARHRLSSSAF